MTSEEFLELKKEFNRLVEQRNEQYRICNRMKELEELAPVREYIKLQKEPKDLTGKTTGEIAYEAASNSIITPTENIYIYIKTVKNDESIKDFAEDMDYALFAQIEDTQNNFKRVTPDELEDFLQNNTIINGKIKSNYTTSDHYHELVQQEYFQNVGRYNQEIADVIIKGSSEREASIKKLLYKQKEENN